MEYILVLLVFIFCSLSCGRSKTSEEMREDHIKAEKIREDSKKGENAAKNKRELEKLRKELNK